MKQVAGRSIRLLARFLGPLAGPENTNPCVGGLVGRKLLRLVGQITVSMQIAGVSGGLAGVSRGLAGVSGGLRACAGGGIFPNWVGCSVSLEQNATASCSGAG